MKIVYITSADFDRTDAPTVRARGLARALAEEGCEVTVLGVNGKPGDEPYRYLPVPYPAKRRIGQIRYQFGLAFRMGVASDFDALLLREMPYCFQPYTIGPPVYLEVNGLAMEEADAAPPIRRFVAKQFYQWGYERARTIFALTPSIGNYLSERVGVAPDRIQVVSNAVEIERLYPTDRALSRIRLDLPPDARIVFYVGSYHRQHGLDAVASAARKLDCLFLMAGQGQEDFRRSVEGAGLADRFRFLGRVDDDTLRTAIGAADLCLNPAGERTRALTDATFPQKVLEYLACGRPVISMGESSAVRAVLQNCGVVVPATAEGLAEGLCTWLQKPDELRGMGEHGRQVVRARYTYATVVQQYLERIRG